MSPRVLDTTQCPHCKGVLARPTPRVCPHCAGSLQKRFFTSGCLTSAPPVLALAFGAWWWHRTAVVEPATRVEAAAPIEIAPGNSRMEIAPEAVDGALPTTSAAASERASVAITESRP